MTLLIAGVLLWSVLHFIPSLAIPLRASLIEKLGDGGYRIAFAIGVVASIVLMVLGWRSGVQTPVYQPAAWGGPLGSAFILLGFILFALAKAETNVKRFLRHPQLTGMVSWAVGHLLANGDNLSVVLFGGLGIWALVEMGLINRREGAWQRPDPVPLVSEVKPIVIGLVIFTVFFVAHPYLFGVSPIPAR